MPFSPQEAKEKYSWLSDTGARVFSEVWSEAFRKFHDEGKAFAIALKAAKNAMGLGDKKIKKGEVVGDSSVQGDFEREHKGILKNKEDNASGKTLGKDASPSMDRYLPEHLRSHKTPFKSVFQGMSEYYDEDEDEDGNDDWRDEVVAEYADFIGARAGQIREDFSRYATIVIVHRTRSFYWSGSGWVKEYPDAEFFRDLDPWEFDSREEFEEAWDEETAKAVAVAKRVFGNLEVGSGYDLLNNTFRPDELD